MSAWTWRYFLFWNIGTFVFSNPRNMKKFVKIVAWYDNEWGYAKQCLEMVRVVAKKK